MRKSPNCMENASTTLREWLPPGSRVHCVLRRVSRSGMQREISLFAILSAGDVRDITYLASQVLGDRIGKKGGIVIGGCGMDMGFALVSNLSYYLYPAGFGCIGEGCPSNDHFNGDRDYTPHYDGTPRDSSEAGKDLETYRHYHKNGEYALRHEWL